MGELTPGPVLVAAPDWRTNPLELSEQHFFNFLLFFFWVVLASPSKAASGGQPGDLFWRVNKSALPWCRALVSGWGTNTLLTAVAERSCLRGHHSAPSHRFWLLPQQSAGVTLWLDLVLVGSQTGIMMSHQSGTA